jgi:hypothetical protein
MLFSDDNHHLYPSHHHTEPDYIAHFNVSDNNYFSPTCSDHHDNSDDDTNRNNDNESCIAQCRCRRQRHGHRDGNRIERLHLSHRSACGEPKVLSLPSDGQPDLILLSFESSSLSPWIPLSAGVVTSGRVAGGSSLSGYAYKFSIDAANPNLPQRLIQPVSLCPNSTYSLKFNSRQSIATGTVSIVGSVQVGTSALLQLAGRAVTGTTLYAAASSTGNMVVPAGTGAVAGVLIIEATFGPSGVLGAKEAYIDEVTLIKA